MNIYDISKEVGYYPNHLVHGLLSFHCGELTYGLESNETILNIDKNLVSKFVEIDKNVEIDGYIKDWKIFKSIEDKESGYLGIIYENKNDNHFVLAHRSTNFKLSLTKNILKQSGVQTDVDGVLLNNLTSHQAKAYEATEEFIDLRNNQLYSNYSFSFTGHSLGAWLAQLSVLYCHDFFDYTEVRCVTFDGPGCKQMMKRIRKNDITGPNNRLTPLEDLDIITYLSIPNIVNCTNNHVGRVFEIVFPNDLDRFQKSLAELDYTLSGSIEKNIPECMEEMKEFMERTLGHSLMFILPYFNPKSGLPYNSKMVKKWPLIGFDNIQYKINEQFTKGIFKFIQFCHKLFKNNENNTFESILHLMKIFFIDQSIIVKEYFQISKILSKHNINSDQKIGPFKLFEKQVTYNASDHDVYSYITNENNNLDKIIKKLINKKEEIRQNKLGNIMKCFRSEKLDNKNEYKLTIIDINLKRDHFTIDHLKNLIQKIYLNDKIIKSFIDNVDMIRFKSNLVQIDRVLGSDIIGNKLNENRLLIYKGKELLPESYAMENKEKFTTILFNGESKAKLKESIQIYANDIGLNIIDSIELINQHLEKTRESILFIFKKVTQIEILNEVKNLIDLDNVCIIIDLDETLSISDLNIECSKLEINFENFENIIENIKENLNQNLIDNFYIACEKFKELSSNSNFNQDDIKDKQNVLVIGPTGSGKSTLINCLIGNDLEIISNNRSRFLGKVYFEVRNMDNNNYPTIGNEINSQTSNPEYFLSRRDEFRNVVFWDMPGFKDNRGVIQEIKNLCQIGKHFEKMKNARVFLVIENSALSAVRGDVLKDYKEFFEKNKLFLFITKVSNNTTSNREEMINFYKEEYFNKNKYDIVYDEIVFFSETGKLETNDLSIIQNWLADESCSLKPIDLTILNSNTLKLFKIFNTYLSHLKNLIKKDILDYREEKLKQLLNRNDLTKKQLFEEIDLLKFKLNTKSDDLINSFNLEIKRVSLSPSISNNISYIIKSIEFLKQTIISNSISVIEDIKVIIEQFNTFDNKLNYLTIHPSKEGNKEKKLIEFKGYILSACDLASYPSENIKYVTAMCSIFIFDQDLFLPGINLSILANEFKIIGDERVVNLDGNDENLNSGNFYATDQLPKKLSGGKLRFELNGKQSKTGKFSDAQLQEKKRKLQDEIDKIDEELELFNIFRNKLKENTHPSNQIQHIKTILSLFDFNNLPLLINLPEDQSKEILSNYTKILEEWISEMKRMKETIIYADCDLDCNIRLKLSENIFSDINIIPYDVSRAIIFFRNRGFDNEIFFFTLVRMHNEIENEINQNANIFDMINFGKSINKNDLINFRKELTSINSFEKNVNLKIYKELLLESHIVFNHKGNENVFNGFEIVKILRNSEPREQALKEKLSLLNNMKKSIYQINGLIEHNEKITEIKDKVRKLFQANSLDKLLDCFEKKENLSREIINLNIKLQSNEDFTIFRLLNNNMLEELKKISLSNSGFFLSKLNEIKNQIQDKIFIENDKKYDLKTQLDILELYLEINDKENRIREKGIIRYLENLISCVDELINNNEIENIGIDLKNINLQEFKYFNDFETTTTDNDATTKITEFLKLLSENDKLINEELQKLDNVLKTEYENLDNKLREAYKNEEQLVKKVLLNNFISETKNNRFIKKKYSLKFPDSKTGGNSGYCKLEKNATNILIKNEPGKFQNSYFYEGYTYGDTMLNKVFKVFRGIAKLCLIPASLIFDVNASSINNEQFLDNIWMNGPYLMIKNSKSGIKSEYESNLLLPKYETFVEFEEEVSKKLNELNKKIFDF